MLGEFLSANVSAPFLLFMVEGIFDRVQILYANTQCPAGFDQFHDESEVGYWTGLLGMFSESAGQ